jgi:hypothetical protein
MKRKLLVALLLSCIFLYQPLVAQQTKISTEKEAKIKQQKEQIIKEEKEALKKEVLAINEQYNKGEITEEEATDLKEAAAEIHALNIENKLAIIDNSLALSERAIVKITNDDVNIELTNDPVKLTLQIFEDEESLFDLQIGQQKKYDKRTHSNLLISFGFNNAIIEGQSFNDSPYKVGKSKYFEMGWVWSTRLLKESNAVRFKYGFSFTFNGLNPTDNQYFVQNGEYTYLENYPINLDKAKLRMDNLVIPIHFEFGPSKKIDHDTYFRYSTRKKFKFGIGGYTGLNLGTRQKLKYSENGNKEKDKFKQSYNTANFIYGLSSYIGVDDLSLYCKYDLNTIFNEPNNKEHNISLGLRFEL